MVTKADILQQVGLNITDSDVVERWQIQDPLILQQLSSMAQYFGMISQEIDVAMSEPFQKTRERSILADATNKGILPTALPHRHILQITNKSENRVNLSQGRLIEDNVDGRTWSLNSAVTIEPQATATVIAEQSEHRVTSYLVPLTEMFHRFEIELLDGKYLAKLAVRDTNMPINTYEYRTRWLNTLPGELVYNLTTDEKRRLFIEFGESERAGRTAQAGEVYNIEIWETEGAVDTSRLKDASLQEVLSNDESRLVLTFVTGGVVQTGTSPYTTQQLKLLTSYSSLYDGSAVMLGNFDYAVRKAFLSRTHFSSVWNEAIQEKYYGVNLKDINHLNVAFVAKNTEESEKIKDEIQAIIASQDNLYSNGRVKFKEVEEVEYPLQIQATISSLHDADTVKAQIKELLISQYGRTTLMAHRWLVFGFNKQNIAKLLKDNILAFQDTFSDFTLQVNSTQEYAPHQWVYMTSDSISIELDRSAEANGSSWFSN